MKTTKEQLAESIGDLDRLVGQVMAARIAGRNMNAASFEKVLSSIVGDLRDVLAQMKDEDPTVGTFKPAGRRESNEARAT